MKKVLALLLCVLTVLPLLCACGAEDDAKGPVIPAYITAEIYNFDPALSYTDDDYLKVSSLLFEGLTKYSTSKRGWDKALAEKIEYVTDTKRDEYKMVITLKDTAWSDNTSVKADDFVFAWKRILDPSFKSEAASLLFAIKNARLVKSGDVSIDDLGVVAITDDQLEITFEGKPDYDAFLRNLASPALVPLRENTISVNSEFWACKSATFLSNGPFTLSALDYKEGTVTFIRNSGYYTTKKDPVDKTVTPYKFVVNYDRSKVGKAENLSTALEAFKSGEILFLGDIPLENRAEYKDTAVVNDIASTLTYCFNTNNELFSNADVRRALSLAIDRNAIADILVFAEPATGLVSHKVTVSGTKTEYRSGNDILSTSADVEAAKQLLKDAGVSGGAFTLTYKDTDADRAVAEYVKGVWESLGFDVTLKAVLCRSVKVTASDGTESTYYVDSVREAYTNSDYDVIAIDMSMLSTDAFTILASFAKEFSGMGIDMNSGNYEEYTHYTGFDDPEYSKIIERAFNETDANARNEILREAEQYLLDQMPVIPLVFNQDAYLVSKELGKVKTTAFGLRDLKKVTYKNYVEPVETVVDDDTVSE